MASFWTKVWKAIKTKLKRKAGARKGWLKRKLKYGPSGRKPWK